MPFDGTKLDETTQVLIRAKEVLLRDGWCINEGTNRQGQHCINGALEVAINELGAASLWEPRNPIWKRLGGQIPDNYPKLNPDGIDRCGSYMGMFGGIYDHGWHLATYNNAQISVEPVLELLDKAIASG